MNKKTYTLVNKFESCGKAMATVIIKGNKDTCVMTELEYNKILKTERKFDQRNKLIM